MWEQIVETVLELTVAVKQMLIWSPRNQLELVVLLAMNVERVIPAVPTLPDIDRATSLILI